jgi:hypothetical protein
VLNLLHPSLSTLRAISKSNLSEKRKSHLLDEMEQSILLLKSEIVPAKSKALNNFMEVGNLNEAIVVYGRLVIEISKLIHSQSLTTIDDIIRMDHMYISEKKVERVAHDSSSNHDLNTQLKHIKEQLKSLEIWLEA